MNLLCLLIFVNLMKAVMDAPCETCGSVRCQRDKKFFIDLPNDFLTRTVCFIVEHVLIEFHMMDTVVPKIV
jgi:hypothetical protein